LRLEQGLIRQAEEHSAMSEPNGNPPPFAEHFEDLLIEDELKDCYLAYAMSVNVSRALPDVRDGLKPVQRRILYAMDQMNLRSRTIKCAKVVGEVMGKFHPHGDSSIYDALVRMAQDFSMRYPLIHPQGNFGSDDGDPPAAMRYTECRLAGAADELLRDLHEETVDWQPNFDESEQEPRVLPARMPNLLVNGSSGIGVAMATNIPPHNLREICDGLVHLVRNPAASDDDVLQFVKGPDFPTRAIICGRKGIVDAYRTGRGGVTVRARYHVEDLRSNKKRLVFTEFPYQVTRKSIVDRVGELVREGKLPGVTYINDASDKDGLKLHVEIKADADENVVINQLFEYTALQHNFAVNLVALVGGRPQVLTLREMMLHYLDHRREVIRRRTEYRLRKARQRAHIVEGQILAIADIDEIIRLIRNSPDVPTARARLMLRDLRLSESETLKAALPEAFYQAATSAPRRLTQPQADSILAMTLSRLTGLAFEDLAGEYRNLAVEIAGYERLLGDAALIDQTIVDDLTQIREKYGDERRTELGPPIGAFNVEDLITEEEMVVTISHEGYIKRVALREYRARGRGTRGMTGADIKDGDFLEHLYTASTHDTLMFFTNQGKVYWLKVYEIPELKRESKGRPLPNLLQLGEGEKIAAVLSVREFDERFVVTATARGLVKKTVLGAFARPMKRGIIAVGLEEGDSLIGAAVTDGNSHVVLGTREGMAIHFPEEEVRPTGRGTYGVKGIQLEAGDEVVDMVIADAGADLLTVCENGYGKRTGLDEYRVQSRGGKGLINIKTTDRNGKVAALKSVRDTDDLMMISGRGVMNRISVGSFRVIGRATQGVRLMNLDDGDKIVAVARVAKVEEELAAVAGAATPPTGDAPPEAPASGEPRADVEPAAPPPPAPEVPAPKQIRTRRGGGSAPESGDGA
jgi:DNA gyrase subunit A